jgi:IS5 family transposase
MRPSSPPSQVDPSEEGEVVHRDKAFQGAKAKGDAATKGGKKRAARRRSLGIWYPLRDRRIKKKRVPGEDTMQ